MPTFRELGVPETIALALDAMGYAAPTDVQARSLPTLLAGRDALVEAQTGSGKTAAFAVPAVIAGSRASGLRALILVPTRELARQVADEVRAIGTGSPFRAVAVTGGVQAEQEERTLAGEVRCLVATPGRLLALVEAQRVRLGEVELVVLDEADRMLDMGFLPDVERVLAATKTRAQTVLVSATIPRDVAELARAHLRDPVAVRVEGAAVTPPSLEHYRFNVFPEQKEAATLALLQHEQPQRAIVFVRTRERANAYWKLLKEAGFAVDRLQGEMTHDQRRHVFDLFTRGTTRVLVATDLASRGLDVPEMELVVNVDLPDEDETYVHRAGRAARMGRAGKVVTLVLPEEKPRRVDLEREAGVEFRPYRLELPKREADRGAPPSSSRLSPRDGKPPRNDAGRGRARR
jgi:ATP-dependent RNA helicase RhlE